MRVSDDLIIQSILAIKDNNSEKLMELLYKYNFISEVNTEGLDVGVDFSSENQITLYEFFGILVQEVEKIGNNANDTGCDGRGSKI